MKEIKYFLQLFLLIISVCYTFTNSFAQDYFPLEIGNRWDYFYYGCCHGGSTIEDTISVEVVGDTILSGKEYFVLSYPFFLIVDKFLRVENDSLYCFDFEDSVDCLIYAFNPPVGATYYSCKYDSAFFIVELYESYFGYPDTQQVHAPYFVPLISYFSKRFGLSYADFYGGLCEYQTPLSGCIISGITYGQLLVSVEDQKLKLPSFKLEQNYPNPFNPVTSIQYIVGSQQLITLKVYDILGREVATLVNEEKPAGEYEVEFDGSNLPSGIYFYQLNAGNYIETKKMILMK